MIDFLPLPFAQILVSAFISLLAFLLVLNVFGLPANWLILGLVALWKYLHPNSATMDTLFFVIVVGLALLGEALEMGIQVLKAKNYGSSSSGTFAGMVGAIAGAILLAPLFFGLGALIGALAGAWLGCLCMEKLQGKSWSVALHAAHGTMMGRFLGTICKCGVGIGIVAFTAQCLWQQTEVHIPLAPKLEPAPMGEMVQNIFLFFC